MRFLSVAERELRSAARQKGTYRIRWISAAAAFALLLWLGWAMGMFQNRSAAPGVFRVFSVLIFLYCLFVGSAATADCISREKREGTLGLLFLTNLNSAEIVAGKLCAHGLTLIYSLLAFFPVMALPVLLGGITFGEFWRTVLALVNVLFFAMAAGFNASAVSVRQFTAIAQATGMALVFGVGLSGAAEIMRHLGCPPSVVHTVAMFSPLHTLHTAVLGIRAPAGSQYWLSLVVVAGVTSAWMALAAWRVGRSWRDQPKRTGFWCRFRFGERLRERGRAARTDLRRRLLDINPFFWLAGRQRVSAPVFMLLTTVLVCLTLWVTAPYFQKMFRGTNEAAVLGSLFAWLWTGLAIHALVLYYGAFVASQRLAEDKQIGALELVLVTPTSERAIGRGLWLAYGRRMLFPILVAVLVHGFFVWQLMTMVVLDPPGGKLPPNVTAGEVFWAALWNHPLRGRFLEWPILFMMRMVLLILAALAANWVMLGWVGRWLGLRMKHPGFAPMAAVALATVPPTLVFSAVCYMAEKFRLFRIPERHMIPILMWVGFGIVIANCVLLSAWAASKLRWQFRTMIAGRYTTPAPLDWLRSSWRILLRCSAATVVLVVALALIVLAFYSYQNWRAGRRWAHFQTELKQRGESLDLAGMLRKPISDAGNFAQTQAFQNVLKRNSTNVPAGASAAKSRSQSVAMTVPGALTSWLQQSRTDFNLYQGRVIQPPGGKNTRNGKLSATDVLAGLKPREPELRAVAVAAQLPFFSITTNRPAGAVLQADRIELATMEELHFQLQLRACALLQLGRRDEAAADVLTGFRLTQLVRQSPDWKSTARVQNMLMRSLQPVWEGLGQHHWTEPQLASFQTNLAAFDLLSDHTNAIGRIVRAYIEKWRAVPETKSAAARNRILQSTGTYRYEVAWRWQPRAWWYDNCIQLYHAGQKSIARVDFAAGRVIDSNFWDDTDGLPLADDLHVMFQQAEWRGNKLGLVSFNQTAVNQGIIACALERYRLAHGTYPENLGALVPGYLNRVLRDIGRGRPLFYLRRDNGQYELRGAGANGLVEPNNKTSDDWLWSFTSPTNLPPVKPPSKQKPPGGQ